MNLPKKYLALIVILLGVFTLALSTQSVYAIDRGSEGYFFNYTGPQAGGTGLYLGYKGNNLNWPANSVTSSDNLTKDIAAYNSSAVSATWQFYRNNETSPFISKNGKVLSISYGEWNYFTGGSSTVTIKVTNIQYDYSTGMTISTESSGPFAGKLVVKYNNSSTIPKSLVDRPFNINITSYADNALSATWKIYDKSVSTTVAVRTITEATLTSSGSWGTGFIGDLNIVIEGITYKDNQRPAISGKETFVTSVADSKPVLFFQDFLSAHDNLDGDITDQIYIINDNYTPNKSTLGNYQVTFGVEDQAGNLATLIINIAVVDITKPVIIGNAAKTQTSYSQTWNVSAFRSTLNVTDNYYTMTSADITIKSDDYTPNKTQLGTYNVVFSAIDGSGNEALFIKQIEVIDDIPPTFSGPSTIQKPATSILTVNDIKAELTASDVKDGNRTSNIVIKTDNFTGHGSTLGSYTIVFEVSDTKNNKATHTVTVNVIDDIAPIWFVKDGVSIILESPSTITRQQIIDLLVATEQLTVQSTTNISFFLDEYQGNEATPGVYLIGIQAKDTSGNESIYNLAITVLDSEGDDIIVDPIPILDWFDDVTIWINENQEIAIGIGVVLGVSIFIGFTVFISKLKAPKKKKGRRK